MRRIVVFACFISFCFSSFGQTDLELLLKVGDSLREQKEYRPSYPYYDSASTLSLKRADIVTYCRALIGKGYALRFDRENPNYEGAYQLFFQALSLMGEDLDISVRVKQDLYYGLAVTERVRRNYELAMEYGDLALILADEMNDPLVLSKCHNMVANIHANQGMNEIAIEEVRKAISIRENLLLEEDQDLPHWYYNLGLLHTWSGSADLGNFYLKKAMLLFEELNSEDVSTISVIYQEIARNFVDLRKIDSAKLYYDRAQSVNSLKSGDSHIASHHYYLVGRMHRKFNQLDSALFYYQKSIIASIADFTPTSILDNPKITDKSIDMWLQNPYLYEVLDAKAETLLAIYENSSSLDYLLSTFNLYQAVVNLFKRLRLELEDSDPSLHLAQHAKPMYENALEVCYLVMQRMDKSEELMNTAYNFIEQIKHTILLKHRTNDLEIGQKFQTAKKIKNMQVRIDQLRREISEAKIIETIGYQGIEDLIKEMVFLKGDKEILSREGGVQRFDEYQNNSIGDIKRYLSQNQLLINYFWGERDLYAVAVSKNATLFRRIKLENLETKIKLYLGTTSKLDFEDKSTNFKNFVESSLFLYQLLLEPLLKETAAAADGIEELIIVPDEKISMIPFGSFITKKPESAKVDYKNLDYLVKEYTIAYSFSSSILLVNNTPKKSEKANSLIGFSSNLLPGTQEEVENIRKFWPFDIVAMNGLQSTEFRFKSMASNYEVIHIASHATSGDLGELPKVVFAADKTHQDDGNLYSYEIYPLQLSNELTVLSACQTGVGKHYKGEGVFSLARGFAFAGSSSILTSLWKVRDKQTTKLISFFYSHLSQEQPVKTALKEAQIDYLKNSDAISAHPSFWSSFILIGDGKYKISKNQYSPIVFWFSVLLFTAFLLLVIFRHSKMGLAFLNRARSRE